jgi:hypothetical protein
MKHFEGQFLEMERSSGYFVRRRRLAGAVDEDAVAIHFCTRRGQHFSNL